MLTQEQVARFQADGFIKGSRVLGDEEVETLQREMLRIIDEQHTLEQKPVLLRNLSGKADAPVWQIVNIWQASEPFRALIHNPVIVQELVQLTGASELRLWHDQIQYKPAQVGGVNMWHQDSPYWPTLMPKDQQITAWVALDDVDEDNGCMSMVPGSHRWGDQISFLHTFKDFDALPPEFDGHRLTRISCPVRRGEVHYHHSLTWHGSHANRSGRPRRAIALHYMTGDTRYVATGTHVMKPFIEAAGVADGDPIQGEHFPRVHPQ
jgi:ectoine hydroxylase-related dioxygenase (phytanoyl-CoA dioxygenase family)